MKYQSNKCNCIVWLREDSIINVQELAYKMETGEARAECSSSSVSSVKFIKLLKGALNIIRETAIRHREFVHHAYKLKVESLPPRLRGGRVYTGQWVGFVEYSDGRECICVVIEPKYEDFPKVYEEVVFSSPRITKSLALAVASLHLGSLGRIHNISLALWLLDEYTSKNPPYRIVEERMHVPLPPANITPTIRKIAHNEKYYATLAASIAVILKALAPPHPFPSNPLIKSMVRIYVEWQKKLATHIISNPQVTEALWGRWQEEPEIDVVLETLTATRHASGPRRVGQARIMLTPAPKIYEIFVLLKTLEALTMKHGKLLSRSLRWFRVGTMSRRIDVYYNYPPRRLSRLVYKMTGSRPHPDILLEYSTGTRIVVDAKYRLGVALTAGHAPRRRLKLKEALRLLGYLADLAHNGILRAILAVPSRAAESASLTVGIDGTNIRIDLAEVNPLKGARELAQLLP